MDAAASGDERCRRIRRSRVVLMPRCWHQVRGDASHHADDGDNKARSPGRARSKPLKPLRREGRIDPTTPVVINSCAFLVAREAAGAAGTRSSPRPLLRVALRPLFAQRRKADGSLGRYAPRECSDASSLFVVTGLTGRPGIPSRCWRDKSQRTGCPPARGMTGSPSIGQII